jgi:hypothetical protein
LASGRFRRSLAPGEKEGSALLRVILFQFPSSLVSEKERAEGAGVAGMAGRLVFKLGVHYFQPDQMKKRKREGGTEQ